MYKKFAIKDLSEFVPIKSLFYLLTCPTRPSFLADRGRHGFGVVLDFDNRMCYQRSLSFISFLYL